MGTLDNVLHPSISPYDLCNTVLPSTESFRVECVSLIYGNIVTITPTADVVTSLNLCEVKVYSSSGEWIRMFILCLELALVSLHILINRDP